MVARDGHAPRPGCVACGCNGYKCKPGCGWLAIGFPCCNPRYAEAANAADAEAKEKEQDDHEKFSE